MQLLKKILPLGVLLLSGCTTVIDEHQGCSPDPVYIYFTSHSDINVDVDITTTRNGEAEPLPIGMMGMGHTADVTPALDRFTTAEELQAQLQEGMKHDKYLMSPASDDQGYDITPSEGVKTPQFPYIDNSAVSIYAYAPYKEGITPLCHEVHKYWYIPLDIKADGGQTDYLYATTTCSQNDYQEEGYIDLDLKHALIRLDVIVGHDEIIIGGGTEDNTEDDDEIIIGGGTEDNTEDDDEIIIGGGTEDNTEDDDEVIIGGGTEDNTEDDDEVIIGGGTEDNTEDESTESTPTISYVTDDNIKANNDYEILAPGMRTTRTDENGILTVKLYTDNNGVAYLRLKDGKVFKQNSLNVIGEQRYVEHDVISNEEAEADTVTFYLVPGTKIFKITVDGTKDYFPYHTNENGDKVKLETGHELSNNAGTKQVITINP